MSWIPSTSTGNALRAANIVQEKTPHIPIRPSYCRKCRGHGNRMELKGHATKCPYHHCTCKKCSEVMKSRSRLVEQRYRKDHPNEDFVIKEQKFDNGNKRLIAYPKIVTDEGGTTSISNGSVVTNWNILDNTPTLASTSASNDSAIDLGSTLSHATSIQNSMQNTGLLWNYPNFLNTSFLPQSQAVAPGVSNRKDLPQFMHLLSSQVVESNKTSIVEKATLVPSNPAMNSFTSRNLILPENAPSQRHPHFQMFLNCVADLERTMFFKAEDPNKK